MHVVTSAAFRALATEQLATLAHRGFVQPSTRSLQWVRAHRPVRHVFSMSSLRAAWVPVWGLSLDFVPHIEGGSLRWHRTDKTARMDVVYDPVDFDAEWQRNWSISTLQSLDAVERDATRVLPAAIDRALAWFDSMGRDLLTGLEAHRTAPRPGRRFGFDNWTQQPLALAFVRARAGQLAVARNELEAWIASHTPPAGVSQRLRALLAETAHRAVEG